MIFIAWGSDGKIIRHAEFMEFCKQCQQDRPWVHVEAYRRFKLYWVPIAKYQRKFAVYCQFCGGGMELTREQHQQLLASYAAVYAIDPDPVMELPAPPETAA